MSVTLRYYIKVFLLFGVGFAVGMHFLSLLFGDPNSLFKSLFHLTFFGGWMTLFTVPGKFKTIKSFGVTEITPENLSIIQKRIVVSSLRKEDAIETIRHSKNFSKMNMRIKENEIQLTSKFSWNLLGEKITIGIEELDSGSSVYTIISRPRNIFQQVDSGQNYKNVALIERLLGSPTGVFVAV